MDITSADLGILILRIGLAFILFAHSTQKLLGWFSGAGPGATAALFDKLGQRPGKVMVYLAGTCEMVAAVLLLLGLLFPLGAAVGIGTMIVAGASLNRFKSTFWNAAGGGEYPIFIALVISSLAFFGPGAVSVDARLDLPLADRPMLVGAAAVLLALVAAVPPLARAARSGERVSA